MENGHLVSSEVPEAQAGDRRGVSHSVTALFPVIAVVHSLPRPCSLSSEWNPIWQEVSIVNDHSEEEMVLEESASSHPRSEGHS